MIRTILPLICTALGFAIASCGPSGHSPAPAAASAAAAPAAHDTAAAAAMASPQDAPQAAPGPVLTAADASADAPASPQVGTPVERRASTLIGMPVVAPDGSSLGHVSDLVFNRQGGVTHLVVAFGGKLTALPWDAAMASIKNGTLVLDATMLQAAPSFTPDAWPSLDDPAWNATADAYWRKAVRASIAASPGNPIDSTSRSRGRQRDGG
jgi:hypothetical protein